MASLVKSIKDKPFWKKPLKQLDENEWEALCDGCGKCCLMKFQDADTDEVIFTKVACKLLDINSCRCKSYENRTEIVKECFRITPDNFDEVFHWLPETCAYKRRAQNLPLPKWHYLVSGKKSMVHSKKQSVKFYAKPPDNIDPDDIEKDIDKYAVYFDV